MMFYPGLESHVILFSFPLTEITLVLKARGGRDLAPFLLVVSFSHYSLWFSVQLINPNDFIKAFFFFFPCPKEPNLLKMPHKTCFYFYFYLFFFFLGPYPWHVEVPRLGVKSETVAASLHHSHSNMGSEPLRLRPILQLMAMPDPPPAEQGQGLNLHLHGS